jgi:hypothetical protein
VTHLPVIPSGILSISVYADRAASEFGFQVLFSVVLAIHFDCFLYYYVDVCHFQLLFNIFIAFMNCHSASCDLCEETHSLTPSFS